MTTPQDIQAALPDLLSKDEAHELLTKAENLWRDLQENNLGGYSGINRPFWIVAAFKEVIEKFGKRDVGLNWSKNDLDHLQSHAPDAGQGDYVLVPKEPTVEMQEAMITYKSPHKSPHIQSR